MRLKFSFPLLLITISLIVCISNYKFGTYLSGWDTLHPEFNFPEYFKRILSVWQEQQGLGAVAAQAHAAELSRVILLFLASFFLPLSFLRYFFFFVTLITGPLGVYFFTKEFISSYLKKDSIFVAFLAGLFFLLNLTTIQQYSVPLEMFATLYGTIGWIFLFATRFLIYHKKRDLWLFVLITILSSPMAHTPTLFYIFFFCLLIYLISLGIITKGIKQAAMLIFLMVALNSYWILPNIYFIKNYGSSVANSKIHSQFSDRAFQVGKNFGDLPDTAIMKNFLFDWGEYNDNNGSFIHLLDLWNKHLSGFAPRLISSSIFVLILIGLFSSLIKRSKISMSLLPVFILSLFFIANDNAVFDSLSAFLGNYFAIIKEALRFPFTKFSIILLFCYSIYFAFALDIILDFTYSFSSKIISNGLLITLSISLIFYTYPVFSGELINSKMRVNIPQDYFQMFDYFKSQNIDGRIAAFPVHTFWGWSYYNFGYEGAGFTWFGIKQPLLNREFDRWHPANEQFYWEISHAVYSEDMKLFESILNKYQVKWLSLDFAITDASSAKSPYLNQLRKFFAQSSNIQEDQQFGTVKLFKVENPTKSKDFIAAGELPKIGPKFQRTDIDTGFLNYGSYISGNNPDVYYPFRSLFTNHTNQKMDFEIGENGNYFILTKQIPEHISRYQLNVPDLEKSKITWFDETNLSNSEAFFPKVIFNGKTLSIIIPKVKGYFSGVINPPEEIKDLRGKNCDFLRLSTGDLSGEVKNEKIMLNNQELLRFESKLANNCSGVFPLNNLSHSQSYIISFESRNIKNKSLLFWLENNDLRKADMEVYLAPKTNLTKYYFIQPPMDPFGTGYTLHFDNWSFNKDYSINDLGEITVYPIPYNFLINLSLTKDIKNGKLTNIPSSHSLQYLYTAKLTSGQKDLILYQSYDPGWQAFYFKDIFHIQRVPEHVLINNWANGWKINSPGTVIIIFLPQLLEFLGFGIFALTIYFLCKPRKV